MLRKSRGVSSSSQESEQDISEWQPPKTIRKLIKGVRKPAEEQWTRVLKFDGLMDDQPPIFSIVQDLKRQREDEQEDLDQQWEEEGEITHFDMKERDLQGMNLINQTLDEGDLRLFAEKVIIVRKSLQQGAKTIEELDQPNEDDAGEGPPEKQIKLNRKFERLKPKKRKADPQNPDELSMDQRVLKKRKLADLSCSEQIDIVHKVQIEHLSHKDTAVLCHVKPALVASLTRQQEQDPQFLFKRQLSEANKARTDLIVAQIASKMYNTFDGIKRSQDVVRELKMKEKIEISEQRVCKVMRERLNLRYKLLKRIAFQANSVRCLIQRQMFAKKMIDILLRGQRVLNIDESWINLKDYSRFRWRRRGDSNSTNVQTVTPRISLITAVDTDGEIYFSLTQVNTDTHVKCLFLSELSALLDVDRPDWRSNTIILMDNASYNRNDVIEKHIKRLGLRVIFSAPYSYDASPIEYLFGYFKQGLLMQQGVASGKRSFHNIVKGVIDRFKQMKKSANVMFWHAICRALYEYLAFKRL